MNLNTVKKALPYLFQIKLVGNLVGIHGVGKSTAIREYAKENGIGFIDLRLGQMEVGDLLGLPEIITDKDGHQVTVFARPKWFPTEGKGILFLDEWNRSKRDVLQAVFQLILDRKIHDYVLPEGWQVIAAQNPSTEDYNTTDTSDRALMDRFCHIKVSSNYQDFLNYGAQNGLNKSIHNFVSSNPAMLRGETKDFNLDFVTPSDRSWKDFVSPLVDLYDKKEIPEDIFNELLVGIVGLEASTSFMAHKRHAEKPVEGLMVLKSYPQVREQILAQVTPENYRSDLLNETKNQVLNIIKAKKDTEELSPNEYDNLVAFCHDLTNELFVDQVKQLFRTPKLFIKLTDEAETGGRWCEKVDKCIVEKEENKDKEVKTEEVPF